MTERLLFRNLRSSPLLLELLVVVLGVLIALVAFEIVLQAVAWWLWQSAGRETAGGRRRTR